MAHDKALPRMVAPAGLAETTATAAPAAHQEVQAVTPGPTARLPLLANGALANKCPNSGCRVRATSSLGASSPCSSSAWSTLRTSSPCASSACTCSPLGSSHLRDNHWRLPMAHAGPAVPVPGPWHSSIKRLRTGPPVSRVQQTCHLLFWSWHLTRLHRPVLKPSNTT